MNCFDEIIRNDNLELFECIYSYAKLIKRDMKEVIFK